MNEAETRAELIDPALKAAGWGVVEASRVRREVITLGRLQGEGTRGKQNIADYVLTYRNHKLAVIEAKRRDLPDTEGVGQAKKYAEKLQARFAYSTNGDGIYQIDMKTGAEQYVPQYPSPEDIWNLVFVKQNTWRDRFANVPFEDRGGTWQVRYYQDNAIENALEAIANGRNRILLTLATGTGKTFIAFQLAWKMFQSRWNRSGEPTRRPRIFFFGRPQYSGGSGLQRFFCFPR
jgi:type I restriction enzyme R subunit